MGNFVSDKLIMLSKLKTVRWVTLFLGFSNLVVISLGGLLVLLVFLSCTGGESLPFAVVSILAGIKIMSMIGAGIAQGATASMILSEQQAESAVADAVIRHERRVIGVPHTFVLPLFVFQAFHVMSIFKFWIMLGQMLLSWCRNYGK